MPSSLNGEGNQLVFASDREGIADGALHRLGDATYGVSLGMGKIPLARSSNRIVFPAVTNGAMAVDWIMKQKWPGDWRTL
jgi:hypothetical protein